MTVSLHCQEISKVQTTNDSSTISKLSMCEAGYFLDPFLKSFVSKPSRRTPLINRGYYVRAKAVHHVLTEFLLHFDGHRELQIVSLGAGFDTSYFRLFSQGKLSHCKFFEVDFPAVVARKLKVLQASPDLLKLVEGELICEETFFDSKHYCVIGCDLNCLTKLQRLLEAGHVKYGAPTVLLSECVLTYIQPERVNTLLTWSAKSFRDALFCTYEQIQPADGFGNVMQQHFISLGSPLKNIGSYPTRCSQERRYKDMGWEVCQSCDMNAFYASLPLPERQRVELLELFDEYEEWHLKCSHYMMLCAFQGCCISMATSPLLPVVQSDPCNHIKGSVEIYPLSMTNDSTSISRYAHSSVLLNSGTVIAAGGFGYSSASAVHGRLDDVLLLKPCPNKTEWENKTLPTTGKGPGKVMHHTTVLLPDGSLLLCGGRTSPAKPLSSFFQLRPEGDTAVWSCVQLDPTSDLFEPRWRHTSTDIVCGNGREGVAIVGGCTTDASASNDCYILNIHEWKLRKLPSALPEGRHSHCAVRFGRGVIIIGGLNPATVPISSCLQLSWYTGDWHLDEIIFEPPLPPRYGAAGCAVGDVLWLLGGVHLNSTSELLMINPLQRSWVGYTVETLLPHPPLLHKHTIHYTDSGLLVVGGGGNYFSFGTHMNSWPLFLNLYL